MIKPAEMTTLSQVMEKLRQRRQDNEFHLDPEGLGTGQGRHYQPQDLKIIKTYRFEGESDPDDSSILYLLETNDGSIGYIVDIYGTYSNFDDAQHNDFIRRIPVEERDEQQIFGE
jgi:hypothetical protein